MLSLAAGRVHSAALLELPPASVAGSGAAYSSSHAAPAPPLTFLLTWGAGMHGRCGHGNQSDVLDGPRVVEALLPGMSGGLTPLALACGLDHTLVLCAAES